MSWYVYSVIVLRELTGSIVLAVCFAICDYAFIVVWPLCLGPTQAPTSDPTDAPSNAPTIHPTMPTYSPTNDPTKGPTSAPTGEVVDGYWDDDFVYVDKDTVTNSGTSDVYDNGWYLIHSI